MTKVLFATNNTGKLCDAHRIAKQHDIEVLSLKDLGIDLDVVEDGVTFTENADKKYYGYSRLIPKDLWIITDDGGLEIKALNGEPGVYSKRWADPKHQREMSDNEILDYTMQKMNGIGDRRARFVGVLSVGRQDMAPHHISFGIDGELLQEPDMAAYELHFPFRALFYLPQYKKMLYEIHDTPYSKRPGILTHREQGLKEAFEYISKS
jgi:XTP/dITP diphosphohydrolase